MRFKLIASGSAYSEKTAKKLQEFGFSTQVTDRDYYIKRGTPFMLNNDHVEVNISSLDELIRLAARSNCPVIVHTRNTNNEDSLTDLEGDGGLRASIPTGFDGVIEIYNDYRE